MSFFKNTLRAAAIATLSAGLASPVLAAEPVNLDELLEQVAAGRASDAQEAQERLQAFRNDRGNQQRLLNELRAETTRQEQLSEQLETAFDQNDVAIIELEAELNEALGDLKELFGVLQQAAGDGIGQMSTSITQTQFPDRIEWMTEFAAKMGQTNRMASLEEIERLWFEIQREMTETGKVVSFPTTVVTADGEEVQIPHAADIGFPAQRLDKGAHLFDDVMRDRPAGQILPAMDLEPGHRQREEKIDDRRPDQRLVHGRRG